MTDQNTQNLENSPQEFDKNPSPSHDANGGLLAKNRELLDKLAKVKADNKTLLSENEMLKNIKDEFNNYKQAEYLENLLFNVLNVIPSSKEFVKFELLNMGYQVVFDENKQAYCFINDQNNLVNKDEIMALQDKFANHVYGTMASGTGFGYTDPHYPAKQLCTLENGVFIGKPQIKSQVTAIAELYQSELEKAQEKVAYYSREIPALIATADRLPNQVLSNDDKLHFGLK